MNSAVKYGLIVLSASIFFGLYPPAARGAYADGANAVFIIIFATLMRTLTLSGFCFLKNYRLFEKRDELGLSIRGGFFQFLCTVGIFGSLIYLTGAITIIIVLAGTFLLLLFMWLKKEIRINKWLVMTSILSFIGLCFVVDVFHAKTSDELIGYVLAIIASVAAVSRLYIYGRLTQQKHPIVVGAETFISTSLFLPFLLFYDMPEFPKSVEGYGWACLSAISVSLGTFSMFYAISKIGAFHFSLYNKMEPVFTSLFSVLLICEFLKWA